MSNGSTLTAKLAGREVLTTLAVWLRAIDQLDCNPAVQTGVFSLCAEGRDEDEVIEISQSLIALMDSACDAADSIDALMQTDSQALFDAQVDGDEPTLHAVDLS